MKATIKYLFWLLAIMFGLLPILLSVAITPSELPKLLAIKNYDAGNLMLFNITVEVVALIDTLEVVAAKKSNTWCQRSAYLLAIVFLACAMLKLVGYSFYFAILRDQKVQADAAAFVLWMIVASFICALGSRTVYIVAEA